MDSHRFDALTRRLGGAASRRGVIKSAAVGGVAAMLAVVGLGGAEAAPTCREPGNICRKDSQCCSNRCRNGRCLCRKAGASCSANAGCCSGTCDNNGTCK